MARKTRRSGRAVLCFATVLCLLAGVAWTLNANANVFHVDTNWTSTGSGTATDPYWKFGDAISAANLVAGPHTIYVADGVYAASGSGGRETFGTTGYTVGSQAFAIQGGYTGYTGSGFDWGTRSPRTSVIDLTGANSRALNRPGVYTGAAFTVDGITFRNSNVSQASYDGGAIFYNADNGGLISINDCLFLNNKTTGSGGGVYLKTGTGASSPLNPQITNSEFRGNQAASYGGAWIQPSNSGYAHALVQDSLFTGNSATGTGGGLGTYSTDIVRTTFSNNTAAYGGGIAPSLTTISQSVIQNNTATGNGGAVGFASAYSTGGATITNCLITNNVSPSSGYTIYFDGHVSDATITDMAFTTLANNTGGGIFVGRHDGAAATFRVRDSLVAFNSGYGINVDNVNPSGIVMTLDYNDVYSNTSGNYGGRAVGVASNSLSSDPLFAVGSYELTLGSPAIDSGLNVGVAVDIRGRIRPYPAGAVGYDMGAYEFPEPAGLVLLLAGASFLTTRHRRG